MHHLPAAAPLGTSRRHLTAMGRVVLMLVALCGVELAETPAAASSPEPVRLYYFWGDGCPVCVQQRSYLDWLEQRHPGIEIHAFEVWHVREHLALLQAFSDAFEQPVRGVPVTFVGDHAWVGFSQLAAQQMTAAVDGYVLLDEPPDAGDRVEPALLLRFVSEAP